MNKLFVLFLISAAALLSTQPAAAASLDTFRLTKSVLNLEWNKDLPAETTLETFASCGEDTYSVWKTFKTNQYHLKIDSTKVRRTKRNAFKGTNFELTPQLICDGGKMYLIRNDLVAASRLFRVAPTLSLTLVAQSKEKDNFFASNLVAPIFYGQRQTPGKLLSSGSDMPVVGSSQIRLYNKQGRETVVNPPWFKDIVKDYPVDKYVRLLFFKTPNGIRVQEELEDKSQPGLILTAETKRSVAYYDRATNDTSYSQVPSAGLSCEEKVSSLTEVTDTNTLVFSLKNLISTEPDTACLGTSLTAKKWLIHAIPNQVTYLSQSTVEQIRISDSQYRVVFATRTSDGKYALQRADIKF